jgi:DNA-binding MarR family transcriptional regulator
LNGIAKIAWHRATYRATAASFSAMERALAIASVTPILQNAANQTAIPTIAAACEMRLDFHGHVTIPDANPREGLFMPGKNHDADAGEFCLATYLPYRLATVTESVSRVFAEHYEGSFNLTLAEWRALAVISEHGTLSPTAVGQRTAMDKVKVSRATQSLVAKGLLRQSPDPRDGRGRLLRLTRKGTATHAGMVPLTVRLENEVFGDLSRADAAALNRVLTKITTRLETNGGTDPG